MPRFAANLSMMYGEHEFLDRFGAAAADGFTGVEFLFPYAWPPAEIAARLRANGLTQALFNMPPGDFDAGERGIAALPGREAEFEQGVRRAGAYALATGCTRLHAMAGIAAPGADRSAMRATYVANLRRAARMLAPDGITVLIEPINHRDIPGYFLSTQDDAHSIREEVGEPNLNVQMDFYHCQIVEGDLLRRYEKHAAGVGHIQVAGVPERHEPDVGEVNYTYLFEKLDALGYAGWVGCEYRPRAGTSAGLGWFARWKDFQR
ncbi:hydroxypyruvate isomerase family protein [Calidifontimicrobium sp. SYSU G02091]|uniref:2-oxo-tetronate isomerase n=1 Tax=Calidifontimicrobium sp. SYSU G02091 TaxID=2926421 RepID=UPI001F537CD9|nr:2-oxo-tetronate isomerase [Calidifontimicrobium sp. SYSU G02091]MCI1191494.1 hydroxypyruvate isomerase family protein [Calidifontimicrobium sp. SYSU G02091]